jgi:hypothetical protein
MFIVPDGVVGELLPCRLKVQGDKDLPSAFRFQRSYEPLDHDDAAFPPYRAESRVDTIAVAPRLVILAPELLFLVAIDVLWLRAGVPKRSIQE